MIVAFYIWLFGFIISILYLVKAYKDIRWFRKDLDSLADRALIDPKLIVIFGAIFWPLVTAMWLKKKL